MSEVVLMFLPGGALPLRDEERVSRVLEAAGLAPSESTALAFLPVSSLPKRRPSGGLFHVKAKLLSRRLCC
jgi:hypothetical protein